MERVGIVYTDRVKVLGWVRPESAAVARTWVGEAFSWGKSVGACLFETAMGLEESKSVEMPSLLINNRVYYSFFFVLAWSVG